MWKLLLILIFAFSPLVLHADETESDASSTLREGLTTTGAEAGFGEEEQSVYALIGGVINVVLGFLGILVLLYIIWAGWTYATSQGEKEKIDKAKKMISTAVIGAIIVVAAYAIAGYVLKAVTTAITTE